MYRFTLDNVKNEYMDQFLLFKRESGFLKQFISFDDDFTLIKGIILALDICKIITKKQFLFPLVNNVIKYI